VQVEEISSWRRFRPLTLLGEREKYIYLFGRPDSKVFLLLFPASGAAAQRVPSILSSFQNLLRASTDQPTAPPRHRHNATPTLADGFYLTCHRFVHAQLYFHMLTCESLLV
jgi:hypothetical protein